MPVDPGIGTLQPATGSQRFFKRWGAVGQLRSIWNSVVPVSVVDRWRSDDEGSTYGITMISYGANNAYTSCMFIAPTDRPGVADVIFEVLSVQIHYQFPVGGAGAGTIMDLHMFSPEATYNPIATLNPVGYFSPGFGTHPSGRWGSLVAFGGYNAALPTYVGYQLRKFTYFGAPTAGLWYEFLNEPDHFQPRMPWRFFPGYPMVVQIRTKLAAAPIWLGASITYREFLANE